MKLLAPLLTALLGVAPAVHAAPPKMLLQMGHDVPATVLAVSPDGHWLATGDSMGTIKLWNMTSGDLRWSWSEEGAGIDSLHFTTDSHTLVSACSTRGIEAWEVSTGKWLKTIGAAKVSSPPLMLTPDGKNFWSLASDGSLQCRTLENSRLFRSLNFLPRGYHPVTQQPGAEKFECWVRGGKQQIWFLAMAPDGSAFALRDSLGRIQIWDAAAGKPRVLLGPVKTRNVGDAVSAAAFSPDGHTFGLGQANSTLHFWDTRSGRKLPSERFKLHLLSRDMRTGELVDDTVPNTTGLGITSLEFSRVPGTVVAGIGTTTEVPGLAPPTISTADGIPRGVSVERVAISPDGQTLVSSDDEDTLRLWSAPKRQIARALARPVLQPETLRLARDGRTLVTGSVYEPACVWDLTTGAFKHLLGPEKGRPGYSGGSNLLAYASRPDVLAVGGLGATIDLWNPLTGIKTGQLSAKTGDSKNYPEISALDGAAASMTLAAGSDDGTIRIWNQTGNQWKLQQSLPPIADLGAIAMSLSADGQNLIGAGAFEDIKVWQSSTGQLLRRLPLPQSRDWEGTFSPDGMLLAEPTQKSVDIWDTGTGKRLRSFPLKDAWSSKIVLWPGTKWAGIAGYAPRGSSTTLQIFDLGTGKPVRSLKDWPNDALAAEVSADGSRLCVLGRDKRIQIRDARDGHLLVTLLRLPAAEDLRLPTNWLAYTPDGHYAASPEGINFIRWRVGNKILPEAAYHKTYFRPDLVRKVLNLTPPKKLKQ